MTEVAESERSPFWTIVRVASILAVALIVVMVAAVIVSEIAATDDTERFSVSEPVDSVRVETNGGHVTVIAGEVDAIEVTRKSHYSIIEPDGTVEVDGATLSLTDGCARSVLLIPNCTVDFELLVPAHVAVEIDGERTDVSVTGISGAINIDTTAADIELDQTSGPVTIEAEGSDILSTASSGPGVTAVTTNGAVWLDYVEPPDLISVTTTIGSVTVAVPQATYSVNVSAANGDVTVGVIDDPTSESNISITNSAGDVTIVARP